MPGGMSCSTAIPSSSFARARKDGPFPMCSSLPKSSCSWTISSFVNGPAASTGLRQSEMFALKWGDIDFSQGTMNVMRSIAYGVVGSCKTEASQKPVPVHPILAAALIHWRDHCRYRDANDWVFANEHHRGRHPY